ncbi:MAG: helix-turn-helix domain-containing protein [Anaerolineae bacterium]|nr:helix-turn-helix domain-containing protein [Anaerolineae bacterium]
MEDWLTTYQAAELSGYNPDYIRQLIRTEKILGRKWGASWQVNRNSLERYLQKAAKKGKRPGPKHRPDAKRR